MLEVQNNLRAGQSLDDLCEEFKLEYIRHASLSLVNLNYTAQSPKDHPIVMETRGLILEDETWDIVGLPMKRFFNHGETEHTSQFDWEDFTAYEKLDGTMILLSPYMGRWIVSTRGTFGDRFVGDSGKTWSDWFWEIAPFKEDDLAADICYIFELWTPFNQVVRVYEKPNLWLLAASDLNREAELNESRLYAEAIALGVSTPLKLRLNFLEVFDAIAAYEESDPTFEGFVLKDRNGLRLKVKTRTYKEIHKFFGNGNLLLPKRLVPLVLSGNYEEVMSRFPSVREPIAKISDTLNVECMKLWQVWKEARGIESQKDFAQYILPRTQLSAILFDIRKRFYGREVSIGDFTKAFRQHGDLLLKKIYPKEAITA